MNDNFKTIKCLEEQLYQILEKLKGVNDEYISSAMNPEDIEKASGIYFEQCFPVIVTSTLLEQFVIKQQNAQSNIPPFQQEQYSDVLRSKSNLSHSSKSKFSKSSPSKASSKHSSLQNHLPLEKVQVVKRLKSNYWQVKQKKGLIEKRNSLRSKKF